MRVFADCGRREIDFSIIVRFFCFAQPSRRGAFHGGAAMIGDPEQGIYRSATIWLELKGDRAVAEAARMATETRRRGNGRAADSWIKIIAALEDLQHRAPMIS